MILQSSPQMQTFPFAESGCFAMSYMWYISKRGKLPDSPLGITVELLQMIMTYDIRGEVPPIDDQCYVHNPDALAQWFGVKVLKPTRFEDPFYVCETGEEEILVFRHGEYVHACGGNGEGEVTYDPLGYSRTVKYGHLESKRIIQWERLFFDGIKGSDQ